MTSSGRHEHCDGCYDLHCRIPGEDSVSCAVAICRKGCGAALHACKEKEHLLLCPNVEVPCLNAHYGCPIRLLRGRLGRHLEVCPASVVCCSQEWNRWPVAEADAAFYRSLSADPQSEGRLDVAMALWDQELLFRSLKMKSIFPELMEVIKRPALEYMSGAWGTGPADGIGGAFDFGQFTENSGVKEAEKGEEELSGEERRALGNDRDLDCIQSCSTREGKFKKEMHECKQTKFLPKERETEFGGAKQEKDSSNSERMVTVTSHIQENAATPNITVAKGFAPWEDGVLERLSKEANVAEYNMYLVHNGAMLINFGQLAACTPREKDFVYGKLEPIRVQTIRSFNVPTSYRAKRNHLKDPTREISVTHQGVDTADLGVRAEELPKADEVSAALLCALEKELRGHPISESAGADGFYVDVGTQTYDFASAPFKAGVSLADVVADRPGGLRLHVRAESVTRRHNKSTSAFSYICGRFFRRDEYRSHFRNVHTDIQANADGWFEHRCPLAYLGCTFSQTRFQPSSYQATVRHHRDLGTLSLQPAMSSSLREGVKAKGPRRNLDPLSRLPFEVLQHVAAHLDSFTLAQLSRVSRLFREVCETLLAERGMVSLKWEKKTYSHGGTSWRCPKKVWGFSSLFSPVERWRFGSAPPMAEHLRCCSFYQVEEHGRPVALLGLGGNNKGGGEEE